MGIGPTTVCLWNGDSGTLNSVANVANVTSGYTQGSTTLVLGSFTSGSLSNLKVGSLIKMNQLDTASDTGNWWPCGDTNCSQQGDSGNVTTGRSQIQIFTVTGCGTTTPGATCSSSSVTVSPAVYAPNWSSGKSPQAGFSSSLPLNRFGLENLTIDTTSLTTGAAMVQFVWAKNSWVKNVSLINNTGSGDSMHKHVWVAASSHTTVRDSYLYGASPTSEGYGVDFWESSDNLAENNICQHMPTCEIMEGGNGNVFGYHYAVDNFYNGGNFCGGGGTSPCSPNWQQCDQFHHNAGDYYNLWEGGIGICHTEDSIHGTAFANTVFRNALSGFDPALTPSGPGGVGSPVPKSNNILAVNNMANARYQNYVNNVLGYGQTSPSYQYVMTSSGDCGPGTPGSGGSPPLIYAMDDSGQVVSAAPCYTGYTVVNDVVANARGSQSSMICGNWDKATNGVHACQTASSASTYPGLSSPSSSYASYPSLYLASTPSWWVFPSGSTAPFPGIGSEVTGGNISNTSGHAWLNPAANCYLNVMNGHTDGSSGSFQSSFDANVCYPTSGPPVCTLSFSPAAGTYTGTQSVTISQSNCPAGTAIYYRTDGLPATVIDTQYSAPVSVSSTQTLTAIAVLNPTIRDQPQTISTQKKCNAVGSPITFPSGYSCNNGSGGVAGVASDFKFTAGTSNQWYVSTTDSTDYDTSVLHIDTPTTTPDLAIVAMSYRNVFQDSSNCGQTAGNLYKCIDVSEFDAENAKDPTTNALWQMSARCSTNVTGSVGNNGFLEGDASSGNEKWNIPCVIGAPTDVTINTHWTLGDTGCGGAGCMVLDSIYLKTGTGALTAYNFPASCDVTDTNCPNYPMTAQPTYSNFTAGSQQQIYARNVSVAGTSPLTTTRSTSFLRVGVHEGTKATGSAAYVINGKAPPGISVIFVSEIKAVTDGAPGAQ